MAKLYTPVGNYYYPIIVDLPKRNTGETVKRECCCVHISGQDYMECYQAKFKASKKKSDYGKPRPFPNGKGDMKVSVGLFGEMAVAIVCGLQVDLEYKEDGDNYDFLVKGETWDVKTAMSIQPTPNIMARRGGRYFPIKDKHIVCFMQNHDFVNKQVEIVMVGSFTRKDFEDASFKDSLYDSTSNFNVYFSDSTPLIG